MRIIFFLVFLLLTTSSFAVFNNRFFYKKKQIINNVDISTFESGSDGWTFFFASGSRNDGGRDVSFGRSSDSHSGSYGLTMDGSLDYRYGVATISKTVNCRSGNITGWAKSIYGTGDCYNGMNIVNNGTVVKSIDLGQNWQSFSAAVTSGTCTVNFTMYDSSVNWCGYISIDDISIPIQ